MTVNDDGGDGPTDYLVHARFQLAYQVEEAGLPRAVGTAWAEVLSAQTLRYETLTTAGRVVAFNKAGFTPDEGAVWLEAGVSPKEACEAANIYGRTVADVRRLHTAAEETVRVPTVGGDYWVFSKDAMESDVATLLCSGIPVHQAETILRLGDAGSALWAVWTFAECLRDGDLDRWEREMWLVSLAGASPDAPANPPRWLSR